MRVKEQLKKIISPTFLQAYHFVLAWLGAIIYRFPSRKMIIIGVTGTSGKSTVVEMIYHILDSAGLKTAALSSIGFHLGGKFWFNNLKMTMPGRFRLQKFLFRSWKNQCQYVVIEVTSEGILQYRHRGIDFNVLVFTNLSPEHIERHGGFENYKKTKGKLFQGLSKASLIKNRRCLDKTMIINLDDSAASYFLSFPADKKIGYGLRSYPDKAGTIEAEDIVLTDQGSSFRARGTRFSLNLPGKFNISNALAAIAVGDTQDIHFSVMAQALAQIKNLPGRLELVIAQPFRVFVDYAHTPVALKKVYQTLQRPEGKMICLLGSCGGGRDKWKRPVLGKIASQFCQWVVLTNEDPYDEDPWQIINQVKEGIDKNFPRDRLLTFLDRRQAIEKVLRIAQPGDTVVITGKGSESLMCLAQGQKIPWSDKKIVQGIMEKLKNF